MARKSREAALQTRESIKNCAFELGTAEGMEALSIGRIAEELGLSKSGVAGHFDSKQQLQLAAVDTAADAFTAAVLRVYDVYEPGEDRLRGLMHTWLDYVRDREEIGGCFLTAAAFEYDDRPGEVRDRIASVWRRWLRVLAEEARAAGLNGARTVFRLHAVVTEAMWMNQLFDDDRGWDLAREAVEDVLQSGRSA